MPSVDHLQECRQFYVMALQPYFGAPKGASKTSLMQLQQKLGFVLPESYRQFLLWMGCDKIGALRGSEWFVEDVLANGQFLDEFLAENGVIDAASENRVCFFVHQGYMAAWFDDVCAADPMCRFYSEANSEPIVTNVGLFTEFLRKELQAAAEAVKA